VAFFRPLVRDTAGNPEERLFAWKTAQYGKQANAEDRFRPKNTDHPAAVVIHGVFGYKMQLEGTQAFYVDPVRNP